MTRDARACGCQSDGSRTHSKKKWGTRSRAPPWRSSESPPPETLRAASAAASPRRPQQSPAQRTPTGTPSRTFSPPLPPPPRLRERSPRPRPRRRHWQMRTTMTMRRAPLASPEAAPRPLGRPTGSAAAAGSGPGSPERSDARPTRRRCEHKSKLVTLGMWVNLPLRFRAGEFAPGPHRVASGGVRSDLQHPQRADHPPVAHVRVPALLQPADSRERGAMVGARRGSVERSELTRAAGECTITQKHGRGVRGLL